MRNAPSFNGLFWFVQVREGRTVSLLWKQKLRHGDTFQKQPVTPLTRLSFTTRKSYVRESYKHLCTWNYVRDIA
jgi:hypothetical protein